MSWGHAEWDIDCDSKLVENLFSRNDPAKKKKRNKHKNKQSDSFLGAAASAGRFVRVNPTTDYSGTSSLYIKPKDSCKNKRKLLAKDKSLPKKIKLDVLNNLSDDSARVTSNEKVSVDETDQSTHQKTRKRKRKKNISLGMSEKSKSYSLQKKIHKKCKDVHSVSKQICNETDMLPSSDFEKSEKNHRVSVDFDIGYTEKNAPKPKNLKEENPQHAAVTIKSQSPYKIKQLKQYLKKHASSPINITPTQTPANSLREKMMNRLKASHFRYINEQLYNSKSEESKTFFQNNISTFEAYHEGYRQQVSKWPLNPLNVIINALKKKPTKTVIADFGCGEANLAKSLPDHKVYSFDFVATSDVVTPCDMSNTPLENESVDIVVFCLSLMGSNLSSYILEANRVLKNGGMMMIAEVESRFENIDTFIKDIKKFGFANTLKDFSHKIFYFLYFKKVSSVKKSNKLPSIFLKPCLYKKR
ncbi:ribosomal RNA-processing protein 8 isoform X1 [Schistocerca cancellata]|uniref:ribosomal RNA-processing protein 8 isoform X1 n=1 Tax=Schistocerca cancellata TaxID=274614 RepID=UPI002119747F|nr:ribosomal RNA-processing protein 8 isoform X1 [Schistocerca cancellata]